MNPFVQNTKLKVIKIYENYTVSVARGETKASTQYMSSSFEIEEQEKTSVYKFPFDDKLLFRSGLKSTGRDLLFYIIYNLPKNQDWIKMYHPRVCKSMGTSKVTFYNGINQLIAEGLICKKGTSEYWINPMYLFTGDRIKYFRGLGENPEDHVQTVNTVGKNYVSKVGEILSE